SKLVYCASRSQPSGNTKKDKIQQTPSSSKKTKIEAHLRNVVQIVLWYLNSGCSKHMTEDRSQLTNFVDKFLGTVKFGNDHVVGISHETSVARSPQQNGVIERCNRTLIEAARTIVDHPAPEVIALIPEVVAPELAASTGSPSSTTVNRDAPSPSNSQSTPETQPPIIHNNVEEDNYDIEVAHMSNDSYFGIPIPKATSDQSLSTDVIHTIVHPDHQIFEHNSKWTNDHPLENIIGELARPVCYYDAFLASVEPKTYKDALT
nr:integrase, catalytic region, zinc finger, CCHC-type, peptidase aspartic, catalytic [Tanacetum cinerariifolium]